MAYIGLERHYAAYERTRDTNVLDNTQCLKMMSTLHQL